MVASVRSERTRLKRGRLPIHPEPITSPPLSDNFGYRRVTIQPGHDLRAGTRRIARPVTLPSQQLLKSVGFPRFRRELNTVSARGGNLAGERCAGQFLYCIHYLHAL